MGRHAGAGRPRCHPRRTGPADQPHREGRDGVVPRAARPSGRRPAARRRGRRARRRGAVVRGPGRPDAREPGRPGRAAGRDLPRHVPGLRRAPARRSRPLPGAADPPPRGARGPRPGRRALARAGGVRRRGDAVRGHPAAGAGGDREQAAVVPLRLRGALAALAEVPPPQARVLRRGRLAARDGLDQPPRGAPRGRAHGWGAGLPWSGRKRHRRQGGTHAQGTPDPVREGDQPVRRRGAAHRRGRHPLGGAGPGRRCRGPRLLLAAAAAPAVVPRPAHRPDPSGPDPGDPR